MLFSLISFQTYVAHTGRSHRGSPEMSSRTGCFPSMCRHNKQRIRFPLLSLRASDSWLLHQNNHIVKYTVFQYTPSSDKLFHSGSPRQPSDARALPLLSGLRYPEHRGPPSQPVVLILLVRSSSTAGETTEVPGHVSGSSG